MENIDTYTALKQIPLSQVIAGDPSIVLPKYGASVCGTEIDFIFTAFSIYKLVQSFLQRGYPIFQNMGTPELYDIPVSENSRVLYDMKHFYVEGIGSVDISQLETAPLLTGVALCIRDWSMVVGIPEMMGIHGAFNIIAEVIARQREYPYDITTMQLPEYEHIRMFMHVAITPEHLREYAIDSILHRVSFPASRRHPCEERCNSGISGRECDVFTTSSCSAFAAYRQGVGLNDQMEERGVMFWSKGDYYTSVNDLYRIRCTSGNKIHDGEEELR